MNFIIELRKKLLAGKVIWFNSDNSVIVSSGKTIFIKPTPVTYWTMLEPTCRNRGVDDFVAWVLNVAAYKVGYLVFLNPDKFYFDRVERKIYVQTWIVVSKVNGKIWNLYDFI